MRTKPLDFELDDFNFLAPRGGGLVPPPGYVFLVDSDGAYLVDSDGAYLIEAA